MIKAEVVGMNDLKNDIEKKLNECWIKYNELANFICETPNREKHAELIKLCGEISALNWVLEKMKWLLKT